MSELPEHRERGPMTALAERPLLYSARPTVTVAGREQPALSAAALSLAVSERADGLYTLEATFGNWGAVASGIGYLYFDRALLDFGADIAIALGAGDAAGTVFNGRITAIEGRFSQQRSPEVLVLAEDRLQDLRMTRRTRVFENKTIEQIVSDVATAHSLSKQVDIESITLPAMAQLNQSDLAFLRLLARIADADVWFEDSKLHLVARARRRAATPLSLVYGQTLHELSVSADLAQQRTAVVVAGWSATDKAAISERAGAEALQAELNGDSSGPAILSQKFGERPEQLVHEYPLSSSEARARAAARLRLVSRRFVSGRGTSEGDARLRVGAKVTLQGVGGLFDGDYFVSEAQHLFDYRSGYRSTFSVERAGLGQATT